MATLRLLELAGCILLHLHLGPLFFSWWAQYECSGYGARAVVAVPTWMLHQWVCNSSLLEEEGSLQLSWEFAFAGVCWWLLAHWKWSFRDNLHHCSAWGSNPVEPPDVHDFRLLSIITLALNLLSPHGIAILQSLLGMENNCFHHKEEEKISPIKISITKLFTEKVCLCKQNTNYFIDQIPNILLIP